MLGQSKGRIELISESTRKVPIQLVGEYFGFPVPDQKTMMRWSYIGQLDNFHNYSFTDLGDSPEIDWPQADAAKLEMKQYIAHLIPERLQQLKENPQLDDILVSNPQDAVPAQCWVRHGARGGERGRLSRGCRRDHVSRRWPRC